MRIKLVIIFTLISFGGIAQKYSTNFSKLEGHFIYFFEQRIKSSSDVGYTGDVKIIFVRDKFLNFDSIRDFNDLIAYDCIQLINPSGIPDEISLESYDKFTDTINKLFKIKDNEIFLLFQDSSFQKAFSSVPSEFINLNRQKAIIFEGVMYGMNWDSLIYEMYKRGKRISIPTFIFLNTKENKIRYSYSILW